MIGTIWAFHTIIILHHIMKHALSSSLANRTGKLGAAWPAYKIKLRQARTSKYACHWKANMIFILFITKNAVWSYTMQTKTRIIWSHAIHWPDGRQRTLNTDLSLRKARHSLTKSFGWLRFQLTGGALCRKLAKFIIQTCISLNSPK